MRWARLLVGGGGVAFVIAGVAFATVLAHGRDPWKREPLLVRAPPGVMVVGAILAGICFILAGAFRSHTLETVGAVVLVTSWIARTLIGRWIARRHSS